MAKQVVRIPKCPIYFLILKAHLIILRATDRCRDRRFLDSRRNIMLYFKHQSIFLKYEIGLTDLTFHGKSILLKILFAKTNTVKVLLHMGTQNSDFIKNFTYNFGTKFGYFLSQVVCFHICITLIHDIWLLLL